ncbi:MAG: YbaK/EbsC family protein [Actinomycetota bacterium]|nr:YbaK/EbsC family protein [Actinomycetota bacterium]
MSDAAGRFVEAAAAAGLVPDVRRFPEGTRTADDAARAIGCDVCQIVKSLVFVAGDEPVLALTSGKNRVDTARLAALCGAPDARKATADEVRAATGYAIGGTPPFGHPTRLRCFGDPDLVGFDTVWAAAGTPDSVFPLAPEELMRLAGARVAPFTGTRPGG